MKRLMQIALVTVALNSAACAPIEVDPIVVEDTRVILSIDPAILKYFRASCIAEHPTYNGAQIEECAQAKAGDFLSSFGEVNQ